MERSSADFDDEPSGHHSVRSSAPPARGPLPEPARYGDLITPRHIDSDAAKVLRRLTRHGYAAYLVGGGVRDLLLGRRPKDFDVATSARPHDVRALFRNCRIIGRRFRLAHVLFSGGKIIETATFRRDPRDSDGSGSAIEVVTEGGETRLMPRPRPVDEGADLLIRHDNVFGEPHDDAIRRDFTINGLFYDLDREQVIDYVGGVPDLRDRVVRTIGHPDIRFREDPIRLLRAIKFSARLDLGLDPQLYDAIVDLRGELQRSAPPRTFEEILRLMRGGAAQRSIYLMWDTGLLSVVLPELAAYLDEGGNEADLVWKRLAAIDALHKKEQLPGDAVLLAALMQGPAEEYMDGARDPALAFDEFFEDVAQRFSVPRRIKDRMRQLLASQKRLRNGKVGNMSRRESFSDAATLFLIECMARDVRPPDWIRDPSRYADAPRRRRRR